MATLQRGDRVSAAVWRWGEDYAKKHGAPSDNVNTEDVRHEGVLLERNGRSGKWKVDFGDKEHTYWAKDALRFVSRPVAAKARATKSTAKKSDAAVNNDSSDDEAMPETMPADSSDDDYTPVGAPEHDGATPAAADKWVRNDKYGFDERARHQFTGKNEPTITSKMTNWETAPLYKIALHFLPMVFLGLMAILMTTTGLEMAKGSNRNISDNWLVTTDDLIQWIGVWIYMLSFPQHGGEHVRRSYFQSPPGGFGPSHNLQEVLRQGGNGDKGITWFENMQKCFRLPTWGRHHDKKETQEHREDVKRSGKYDDNDPFKPTRRFWDHLRCAFFYAVSTSWLLIVDESMVQWQGRGMPGLMVVLRKPTPIGLELHTLCCALCGILVWFEVYEGKEAMVLKPTTTSTPRASRSLYA